MQLNQLLLSCARSFRELLRLVNDPRYNYKDEVSAASWIDELGRLRNWAGNVGAHQTGPSSLEFRLRDSSHIRDEVTNLLTDLGRVLAEAQTYISSEDLGSETSSAEDSTDEEPMTELQALFEEVVTIIQCLYKLAMIIRNPAQHDFLAESYKTDTAAFEPFDEQHVRNKFPQAKEELIHHLAKALTRRRGYLKYRARHSMKLEKGLENIQLGGGGVVASISETTASVLQANPVDYNETSSDSGISQTSYASSLVEGGTITVPPPPKRSLAGDPFPCPYCHFIINPTTTHSWHRHVFTDLRPYICIYHPCRTPDKLFQSRHDWLDHIRTIHFIKTLLCPLCKAVVETAKQYERHVARHMEELALFVLPRLDYDDEEEEGEPDKRSSSVSDSDEIHLRHDADKWLESTHQLLDLSKGYQDGSRLRDADSNRTDILILKYRATTYPLCLPADAIADGGITVGEVRRLAGRELKIEDPNRVKLIYQGKILRNDILPCREEGLKQNSEILCVVSGASSLPSHYQSSSSASEDEIIKSGIGGPRVDSSTYLAPEMPAQKPPPKLTNHETVEALASRFHTEFVPQCVSFTATPPTDPKAREFEYKKLSETILAQIILKLDTVEIEGDEVLKAKRREVLRETQNMLSILDTVGKPGERKRGDD
ncbi:MAG: hypothetical protein Q9180_003370 [Flavoplaca navasiana]